MPRLTAKVKIGGTAGIPYFVPNIRSPASPNPGMI